MNESPTITRRRAEIRMAGGLRKRRVTAGRNRRRQQSRHGKVLRVMLLVLTIFSLGGAVTAATALAVYHSYVTDLPDAAQLAADEPPLDSDVYAANGELIYIYSEPGIRHEHASLDQISLYAQEATVDVEDRHFYSEGSWDLPRIAESAYTDLQHEGATQGASTITEQLAKVSFLPQTQTIDRKIKQVILGQEITDDFSKTQILEMYLNRVDYGNQAEGIATAATLYFHTSAANLDLAQASMLAGLPQSPSYYDPAVHAPGVDTNPQAKARQKIVLQAMVTNGDITQAEANEAYLQPLTFYSYTQDEPNVVPDFTQYLTTYLNENFGDAYLDPGGWTIHTTINLTDQKIAQAAVHKVISANRVTYNAKDAAVVSINPANGEVLAMVGGYNAADPADGDVNMAVQQRQPGSSIKLFTYSEAIASREFTMNSEILNEPVTYKLPGGGTYSPQNYSLTFSGDCPLKVCFANSYNVPAVKVEVALGISNITDLEIDAGLTQLSDPDNRPTNYQYSATLGALTVGVSPLEMADGAATIADLGVHHDPTPVTSIDNTVTSSPIWTYNPAATARQVIPADAAFIISEITSNDSNRQPEFPANGPLTLPDRRVSAKTGTTQFYTDNWTVGWTPQLVSAVWVGNPTPSCLKPSDTATLAHYINEGDDRLNYSGVNITDPFSPEDLAAYGLKPINDACGHLVDSDGLTGAAPIWNSVMEQILKNQPKVWYTKPADVIEVGTGDDGSFYMPGTISPSAATTQPAAGTTPTTGCWYYAAAPQAGDSCTYLGPG